MPDIQLITLDPGHFHAALVQKEMYPGVTRRTHVYAPLGADLLAHLARIVGFNNREPNPAAWELEVHAGPDFLDRLLHERPGNVVVLAGRNRRKIDYIEAAVAKGWHVLADKPWIIRAQDMSRLAAVLDKADRRGTVAYDMMTERHEITSILQQAVVQDTETFGKVLPGDEKTPGVFMESVHYLRKTVAGAPLRRPAWFFDIDEQGEGLSDVGTHLVDLANWILYPDQSIDHAQEVQLLQGRRWPTELTRGMFTEVTGEANFPPFLTDRLQGGRLPYFCNNFVGYTVRGVHVQLNVLWDYQADIGGDSHLAGFRGSRSRVEVRQGRDENFRPELYVIPNQPSDASGVRSALESLLGRLGSRYPGVTVEPIHERFAVRIPEQYRIGHEAHFAEVTRNFLSYLANRSLLPAWEKPNMLAKYFVSTGGVAMAR